MTVSPDPAAYATLADVQAGFEKQIPGHLHDAVHTFLSRASRRLRVKVPKLAPVLATDGAEADVRGFVRDLVSDAAERKLRNFGGFSVETAGQFSVTRYADFAHGRIAFDPDDLASLNQRVDVAFGAMASGPVRSTISVWRQP